MSALLPPPQARAGLRELLARGRPLLVPGAYDALSARLVAHAGFDAVYMTGFGTSAGLLGLPDVGLLTGTEMVDNARRIAGCVDIPVVADADTGYGSPVNVLRTVRDFERAGVAAVQLEDQINPKKCGHLAGKQVVAVAEMVAKVGAAVAARDSLLVIARTDAVAVEGLHAAIDRARAYRDAGADLLFVEAPGSLAEVEQVAAALTGVPLVFNWVEGGRTPPVPLTALTDLGFAMVLFPVGPLFAATQGMRAYLDALHDGQSVQPATSFAEFTDLVGLPEIEELGQRFS